MKLTPWFPSKILPTRAGVYIVDKKSPAYAYWNGCSFGYRCWSYYHNTDQECVNNAFLHRYSYTVLPKRTTWRGLAEKPK